MSNMRVLLYLILPQYYVENSHPAIVSAEMFDMVQEELARRNLMGRQHNSKYRQVIW